MSTDKNGSNARERRHFSPQQKVAIVKEHLVDGLPISDLCDRHPLAAGPVLSVAEAAL
jgi:transposase-like protein